MQTFPWYFSLFSFIFFFGYFSYLLFGQFLLLVIKKKNKKKNMKNFYSVGNSANETLFLLNIKNEINFTARSVLLILHQKSHHRIKSKREEKKVLIIYLFYFLTFGNCLILLFFQHQRNNFYTVGRCLWKFLPYFVRLNNHLVLKREMANINRKKNAKNFPPRHHNFVVVYFINERLNCTHFPRCCKKRPAIFNSLLKS